MLSEELLKIICCPKCHEELIYNRDENKLICSKCNHVYRIDNDIPILIIEEETSGGINGSSAK